MKKIPNPCPNCNERALILHPAGRMCACEECGKVYHYPSMEEMQTQYQGGATKP